MSLASIIASDTSGVLLDADNLAQEVEHKHPRAGVSLVTVQFFGDALDMGQPSPTTERGTVIRQIAVIEVPASVEVIEEESGGRYPSYFSIGGVWWLAKRIVGTDDDSQTVEIHRTDQKSTKRAS
jgi:hypothetical protein